MKKSILILALLAITSISFGQTKPKYKYSVTLSPDELNHLLQYAYDCKDQQLYNPKLTNEQKVSNTQNIDMYLFDLHKRLKIDSVLIDTSKVLSKNKS
jgi:hypothetical protein